MTWNYKRAIKSALWGAAGLFISITILAKSKSSIFGYPLYVLSLLMFILAFWQFYKDNNQFKKSN